MKIENMFRKVHPRDALAEPNLSSAKRVQQFRQSAPARAAAPSCRGRLALFAGLAPYAIAVAGMFFALALLSSATVQPAAAQTTAVPGCGYLNGPPCSPVDNEFWNIYFSAPSPCDFGLIWDPASLVDAKIPQQCTNDSRQTLNQPGGWLGWAMNEQRYNIQADTPINLVTTLGTHNSYSSYGDGSQSFITVDQKLSIWDQLQAGARYIRLDPDYYYGNERLCHASSTGFCEAGSPPTGLVAGAGLEPFIAELGPAIAVAGVITPGRLYAFGIIELAQWMDANPNEFVILDIHMGESGCGNKSTGAYGRICEHNDLLFNPIRDFIGTSKIFYPPRYTDPSIALPTMRTLLNQGKRLMIIASDPIVDGNDVELAFDRSSFYTETESKNVGTWALCKDDAGKGLWDGGVAKFGYASEDRTASVTLLSPKADNENYGYLNAAQVSEAANCGYGIIAVDFMLNQGLTQLPLPTQDLPFEPDMGTDKRREASIWSFDEGDMGDKGPAIMKPNGRWSSDQSTAVYPYACVNKANSNDWVLSAQTGGFYHARSSAVCPDGYAFGAPATGPQNVQLAALASHENGVWLNYIGSVANLVSGATPASLAFEVNAGTSSAASQQITVNGPPNTTVLVNALARVVPILSVPSQITFDANGSATFSVSLLSSVSKLSAGFYGSTVFINAPIPNTGSGPLDLVVSHTSVSVLLTVRGPDTVLFSASVKHANVSSVVEGTPIHIYGQVTNVADDPNPPTGSISLRAAKFDPSRPTPSLTAYPPLPLTVGTLNGTSYSYAAKDVTLPPGRYQLAARYPGDVFHLPAVSPAIDFTVQPWLNVSPQSFQLTFVSGNPGAVTRQIAVNNFAIISAPTACAPDLAGCWLQSKVVPGLSSQSVTLSYTSFAAQLAPGNYNATVTIQDGHHTPVVVQVALTVIGTMKLMPAQLKFFVAANLVPEPQPVAGSVENTPVPLSLQGTSVGWLTYKNGAVVIDTAHLPKPGIYSAWLDLQETKPASGQPISSNLVRLPVTVEVVPLSTVSTSPTETVTVDGVDYVSPAQFAWVPGTRHTVSVPQTIPGEDGGLIFTHWSDLVTSPIRSVIAPSNLQQVNTWNAIYVADLPNFTVTGRTLDTSDPNAVVVQINLSNSGPGLASQLSLTSVIPIAQTGLGIVSIDAIPPGNMSFIAPGQTGGFPLTAQWPPSVTSITVTVSYKCNGGAVTGSANVKIDR